MGPPLARLGCRQQKENGKLNLKCQNKRKDRNKLPHRGISIYPPRFDYLTVPRWVSPPANLQSLALKVVGVPAISTYNLIINSITHQLQCRKNTQRSRVALNRLVRSSNPNILAVPREFEVPRLRLQARWTELLVDLVACTWTCGPNQANDVPSGHAVAYINKLQKEPRNYIPEIFSLQKYLETYNRKVLPVDTTECGVLMRRAL
jgi:hypothetical protein